MTMRFFLAILAPILFTLTGCTSANREFSGAANPQEVLIKSPRACVGENIQDAEIREFCLELAKLEAHRAEEAAKAVASAQAAKATAEAEKAKIRAANPCASWFMAPSHCYVNGVFVGSSGTTVYRGSRTYGTGGGGRRHRHTNNCPRHCKGG